MSESSGAETGPAAQLPVNDETTSATDDSSVGFGNRPAEFLEDTSPHTDGPPEEPGIDRERDLSGRVEAARRDGSGTLEIADDREDNADESQE